MVDQYVIHELQGSNVWAKDGERLGLVGNVHLTGPPASPHGSRWPLAFSRAASTLCP